MIVVLSQLAMGHLHPQLAGAPASPDEKGGLFGHLPRVLPAGPMVSPGPSLDPGPAFEKRQNRRSRRRQVLGVSATGDSDDGRSIGSAPPEKLQIAGESW